MTAEIVELRPGLIGDGIQLRADDILEAAKGQYRNVVIVGETEAGGIEVCGTQGAADALMLLQWASHFVVTNRVERS